MLRAFVIVMAFFAAVTASARVEFGQDIVGGDEGTPFTARCPNFTNLVGLDLFTRDDVDAVQLICASAYGPGELAAIETVGAPIGGRADGANRTRLLCAGATPVVTGAYIKAEIRATSGVNNIHLFCGVAGANASPAAQPLAVFDGPPSRPTGFSKFGQEVERTQHCQKNFVAVGIRGSSTGWINGLALICGEPGFTARSVGRTPRLNKIGKTAAQKTPGIGATDFCESYANDAVAAAIDNRRRACGGDGGRWTTDFSRHFDWCVSLKGDRTVADAEASARAEALSACTAPAE
jgi:hypothetical protein